MEGICSKFNLEEEKILHLIFSQIKPNEKNDTIFKLLKLDFFNKLELKSDDKYTRYAKIIEGLINKSWMKIKDEKNNPMRGYVVSASRWNYNEPFFEVELSRMFMPLLQQLVRDYTKIELDSVLKLKSKHSLTLYKWLCSWTDESKKTNQRYLTTKELKELLGLSIDDYVCKGKFNRTDFERYTIKVAINEISEKTNLSVQFKKNKKGNKIQNYEFTWTKKNIEKPQNTKDKNTPVKIGKREKNSTK
ncbi:replication initiation protein [Spiroplasma endosymbiont of Nebria brevicollis]|uniref:replication initiation protein n=1 Tax=Spiroplasma endosymbiont of Nebria brevicollis TaxID=3066284 RepID=UPI00313AD09C